jgi:PncC family amidohydrolase
MWSLHVALDGRGAGQALDEIVGGIAPARRLVDCCHALGWTLACAESLTGGLLAMAVSVVPGSSDVFIGSVVAYQSEAKHDVLDVPSGPVVSGEAAVQMARGAAARFGSDLAIGVTGVAGPMTQEGMPVGTVFVAAVHGEDERCHEFHFDGVGGVVRLQAVLAAADLALEVAAAA